jgi:predicted PurR-regulated permease PerM
MNKAYKVEISSRTIIFAVLFILLLQFLWTVRDLIFSLLIAFIVMSAMKPAVSYLEKKKIPRIASAITIVIVFLLVVGYVFFGLIPPLITETSSLISTFPFLLSKIDPNIVRFLNLNSFNQYLPDVTGQLFNMVGSIFSNTVFVLSTLFFSLYFIIEEDFLRKLLPQFFSEDKAQRVIAIFDRIEKRMSAWFWGELILMVTVGLLTFIGLNLIGLKYAPSLAILAGLLEVVPNFGPILSAVPALLLGLSQSYFMAAPVIALYFIVQQLENNLIVPLVMKRAVGLHPIVTLVALIIGGKVGGVLGVLLAIPTTLFIETLVVELIQARKKV